MAFPSVKPGGCQPPKSAANSKESRPIDPICPIHSLGISLRAGLIRSKLTIKTLENG